MKTALTAITLEGQKRNKSLHLPANMLGYLSANIICSEKLTVFRKHNSRKTVSRVYYPSNIFRLTRGFKIWGISLGYPLGRVRLGSIPNKNNWNNASKRLFGSYSHSGIPGFPFRLFCSQEQNSWNIFRNIFLFRNIPNERALSLSWGIFSHVTRLDQSRESENIWRILRRISYFTLRIFLVHKQNCLLPLLSENMKFVTQDNKTLIAS